MSGTGSRNRTDWLPHPALFALWTATRVALVAGLGLLGDAGDGVMPLTFGWVQEMLRGTSPYHERGVAYPPLAMFLFALAGLGEDAAVGYATRFVLLLLCADLAGLCLASRAEKKGRRFAGLAYTLATPAVGPILLLWRYDLIPAVFHLAAGVFLLRGSRRSSWAMLGAGIALKPYLSLVVPLWTAWELKAEQPSRGRRLVEGGALALLPSLVASIAMLPLSGLDFLSAYTFQTSRGLQVESGPAVLLTELAAAGVTSQQPVFSPACLCWERTGPLAGALALTSTALVFVMLAGLVLAFRRAPDPENLLRASCAAVLVPLVAYRVFSPQYLLWALVPLVLLVNRRQGAVSMVLVAAAGLVSSYLYPLHYADVITGSGASRWLLPARGALLLASVALLAPRKRPGSIRQTAYVK